MRAATHPGLIVAPDGRPAIFHAIENNWYEGSRWSPHRSFIWFPVQEADRDLDRFTRYELIKHSQYLVKNSPFIRGLLVRLVTLTIGSGAHPVPNSGNPNWNRRAKRRWNRICKEPCVDTFDTMGQYQRIKCFERFMDGESFTILTQDRASGMAGLQGKQADRITSQQGERQLNSNEPIPVDGIIQNAQGKPIAYLVRGAKNPIPARFMVHHGASFRSCQHRKEPILASCINWARDVDDILALEKQAVKEASGHKDIIKTKSGEIDPETYRKLQFNQTTFPTNLSLPADDKARNNYYKVQMGSETVTLLDGDDYISYKPDRPGAAWQGFMDFLSQTICLSTGLPASLVLPVEIGGTDIRRDNEIAQRVIETWQTDIAAEWQKIWDYLIGVEVEYGALAEDAPDDWDQVLWYFPKSITVDRSRDAQQDRADVAAGLMSHNEYHGRYGDHGEEYEEEVEAETRRRRFRICGIPIEEPFEDARDYASWLSMTPQLLTSGQPPTAEPGSGDDGNQPQAPKRNGKAKKFEATPRA